MVLLGNKADNEPTFDQEEVEKFCKDKKLKHYKVSAKTGKDVSLAFSELSSKLATIHPKI